MTRRSLVALALLAALAGSAGSARAFDHEKDSAALRSIHAALAPSVVQVDAVVRTGVQSGVELDVEKSFFGVVSARDGARAVILCPGEFFDQGSALDARVASVRVRVAGGREFDGEFLGQDDDVALAFVRVDDAEFDAAPAAFAADDAVLAGDFVATVRLAGPSFGHAAFIDAFLVSATVAEPRCFVSTFGLSDSLGAPVAAFDGRVIGMVLFQRLGGGSVRRDPATGARETSLFAPVFGSDPESREVVIVPVSAFRDRLGGPRAASPAEAPKAWLGVEMQVVLPEVRRMLGLAEPFRGVEVTRVLPGSPADAAGLRPLDLVSAIDGVPFDCVREKDVRVVRERLAERSPGDTMRLAVRRGAEELAVDVLLGVVPAPASAAKTAESDLLGLRARDLVYADRADLELEAGTGGARLLAVKPAGRAGLSGARVGDVVLEVNGEKVKGAADLAARAGGGGRETVLFIRRGRETRFVKIR